MSTTSECAPRRTWVLLSICTPIFLGFSCLDDQPMKPAIDNPLPSRVRP
jgi:hypothetical protein